MPQRQAVCLQGMLAIGCALLGAAHVIGIDIDEAALEIAAANAAEFEELPIDFVCADATSFAATMANAARTGAAGEWRPADVVVCNPPFGSWNKGADVAFLNAAFQVCSDYPWRLPF